MKIYSQIINKTLVLYLYGDIDHHNTEIIKRYIYENMYNNVKNIVVDLNGVEFMDSSGIGMLLGRYKELKGKMGSISLVGIRDNMERIYRLSGLYRIIKNYDSVKEAVRNMEEVSNE